MINEDVSPVYTAASTSATAAGTGDNTAVTGDTIDLTTLQYPAEVALVFAFIAVLAAGKSLFLKSVVIEHGAASNMSDAATLFTLEDATGTAVATSAGGGTVKGVKKYGRVIKGAKRYVRIKFTPDLDATGTDTAVVTSLLLFGAEILGPAA